MYLIKYNLYVNTQISIYKHTHNLYHLILYNDIVIFHMKFNRTIMICMDITLL